MFLIKINPMITVTVLGRMTQRFGWEHNGRENGDNVLLVVIKGNCVFQIGEVSYPLASGEALIIPAKTVYKGHTDVECDYYFFHFKTEEPIVEKPDSELPAFINHIATATTLSFDIHERPGHGSDIAYVQPKTVLYKHYEDILFLTSKCLDKLAVMGRYDSPFIRLYFTEILMLLDLQFQRQSSAPYPVVLNNMISFINQNYTQPISLQNLSDSFQLSKQYIARLFVRHLGVTANSYILMVKLYHAQEFLKFSRMNITEISNHLGFCSTSHFSRVFKQCYTVSPKQYQNSTNIFHNQSAPHPKSPLADQPTMPVR